jgi:hypothetical protein
VIVTLLRVDCRDDAAADEFDKLTARVFQQVTHHEPGTLVFANHMVAGQPLTPGVLRDLPDRSARPRAGQRSAIRRHLRSRHSTVMLLLRRPRYRPGLSCDMAEVDTGGSSGGGMRSVATTP